MPLFNLLAPERVKRNNIFKRSRWERIEYQRNPKICTLERRQKRSVSKSELHCVSEQKGLTIETANLIGHVREQKKLHQEGTGSPTKITRIELDLSIAKTTKLNGYVCGQKMLRQERTGSPTKTPE